MKKKLNLFCVLIFVVLVCDVMSMSGSFVTGFSTGMRHGREGRPINETNVSNHSYVPLLPVEMTEANAQAIVDKETGRRWQAWPTQLVVPRAERMSTLTAVFKMAYTLVFGAAMAAALVAFTCFVRNVNKNKIFTQANIRLLRVMGWCLVAGGLITTADACYDAYTVRQSFSLTGYIVDYGEAVNLGSVIFGLFSLVIAEALAIARKMKEEQELTI